MRFVMQKVVITMMHLVNAKPDGNAIPRLLAVLLLLFAVAIPVRAASFVPDKLYLDDRAALEQLQRAAFSYIWEDGCPDSGMAYEANYDWEVRPVAVGGSGFGVAAIVVAADREWISREAAVARLMKTALFLRDKTGRKAMHGAFPHWLNGATGEAISFGQRDAGADIVETSLLMQGLLIARAYFNGPGVEEQLRDVITELWEDVEWDWFTNGEDNGLYWHWDMEHGFYHGLKILGYNECLVTYVLAMSSPTHPIGRRAYDYWTSGVNYQPQDSFGYEVEASPMGGGPLFLAHYSFIGLNPRLLADAYVKRGYFVRGVNQTLGNRGYCLYEAPEANRYGEGFWGLTASHTKDGYTVSEPLRDYGTVAPTAALSSMPYTPHYSMQMLHNLLGGLKKRVWGKHGPYDAISLREDWVSDNYLAIDQLPIVCMVENHRSGLLWDLLMSDRDVRRGLGLAGLGGPDHREGFPEAVVALRKDGERLVPDAFDIRRHPDSGCYVVPYWLDDAGVAAFRILDAEEQELFVREERGAMGANALTFAQFMTPNGERLTLVMKTDNGEYTLPLRLH